MYESLPIYTLSTFDMDSKLQTPNSTIQFHNSTIHSFHIIRSHTESYVIWRHRVIQSYNSNDIAKSQQTNYRQVTGHWSELKSQNSQDRSQEPPGLKKHASSTQKVFVPKRFLICLFWFWVRFGKFSTSLRFACLVISLSVEKAMPASPISYHKILAIVLKISKP